MNCYLESIEAAEGKNKFALRGIPGIQLFKDLTVINGSATPVRGLWSGGGRVFVAAGTKEFEVDSTGALVGSVNTIADDAAHSPVQIFQNRNQIFLVSAGLGYCDNGAGPVQIVLPSLAGVMDTSGKNLIWRAGDTFDIGMIGQNVVLTGIPPDNGTYTVASVTNPKLAVLTASAGAHTLGSFAATVVLGCTTGCFLDGYFIVHRPSSWQFNISALRDGTTWSQLDFDIKSGYPDNLMAVWAEAPLLYLLGSETMEIWRNTGNADFPFQRVDGGFAKIGLAATWSPASIAGKLHMLAGGTYGQTVAVRMEGITPVRISTHAVEEAWAAAGSLAAEGVSYSYLERGHWHWAIHFAGNTRTWVYDATESGLTGTPQWHQRARWDNAGQQYLPYRPWFHTFVPEWGANGKHIVGDYLNGKLYEMSSDFFDDDGTDIRAVRAMSHLWNGGNRMFMSRIEIEHEAGMSWNAGANTPSMSMDFSDDRGHTFHPSPARSISTGAAGAYSARSYLNRCGSFRDRVPRLTIQGQSKIAIVDANGEIEMGTR